ncbi:MAG: peptidoglycan-binding domain-containing protein [Chthoniobacteraceae bacterium]
MKRRGCVMVVLGWALAWSGVNGLSANEPTVQPVAAAQAFLKDQRLYRGPVDGVASPATAAAVRRYQILHGFRATGLLDEPTLAAMLAPPPRPEKLTQSDRDLLRELESTPPPPPVAEQRREPIPPPPPPVASATPQATPSKSRAKRGNGQARQPHTYRVPRSVVGD